MSTQILLRRHTDINKDISNIILGAGEPFYDITTHKLYIGDGISDILNLPQVNVYSTPEEIVNAINSGSLLINSEVFDVYTGKGIEENKKSLAYSLEFGTNDRTLTDEEINNIIDKIIANLEKNGAEIRKWTIGDSP